MKNTLWITCLLFWGLNAQELPPIQNFYPKDYQGENQNWAISQSAEKLIYVANSKGLLEYNGANWTLYPSPNETIMRSVRVVRDRIYTGCFMEFGYWKRDALGSLVYTSLSKNIAVDLIEDEEFWEIFEVEDYMVFQSLKRIYIYNVDDGSVNTIESNSTITKMYRVDEDIYFQRMGQGLYKIESGKDFLVFNDEIVKNDEVIHVFPAENDLLVLTKNNGFYRQKDSVLVASENFPNACLSQLSLYDGVQLEDESYILGTISNGLIYLNNNGELRYQIDQDEGLLNNTVLSLFEDRDRNIWLGLDHGISYINIEAPYKVFNDFKGVLGSVYASSIHEGKLYLGTNQGLFYRELDNTNDFELINGTQGQVWCLEKLDGKLFCGHNSGTFLVNGNKVQKIASVQGTWDIAELKDKPNLLLQGNYDGLYILEKSKGSWRMRNKIKGFNNSSRYFETLGTQVLVNHEYNGVFKITVDSTFSELGDMKIDTVIKGSNSGIVKYNGKLFYAYKKGIFEYDETNGDFQKDSVLSTIYTEDEYESGKLIVDESDNTLWVFTTSNISYVTPVRLTRAAKMKRIPLTKEMREGILGYENITRLDDSGNYLLGKTSGYMTFNLNGIIPRDFRIYLANVSNGIAKGEEVLRDRSQKGNFKSHENNLGFSFYAPEYHKYLNTQYQYRLQGLYDSWSNWSQDHEAYFENLPFGEYVFYVRAKIGDTVSENTASYSFSIAKPWYISNTMIVLYILGILLFSLFMHTLYRRYYKKQRLKLIEKNQKELEFAQVQNEKEIIRIKNKQLELENKNKGKELAASTMNIIKKNELLTNIKSELKSIRDQNIVKPVIKIIDNSLNQNDDWELFQEAFNNADSEFLKNIKKMHPSLSPNDLKLCAYLRLNLSSKEIAQLLNISPKSVEIKRYRLRKKLDLQHEDNLVNYILEL